MKDHPNELELSEESESNASIHVECGLNKAVLHLDRLCQGSKGACILFEETWMTPNEFQAASGRETAKDWKRSIKHHDKSLKLLMIKGVFSTEPAACSCDYCTGTEVPPSPQTASVTKLMGTQKANGKATNHKEQNTISGEQEVVRRTSGRRGRTAFKTRNRRRPRAPLTGKVRIVRKVNCSELPTESAMQSNETDDNIVAEVTDANSYVSGNLPTLVEKANNGCDKLQLETDKSEGMLTNTTRTRENSESHQSNTDSDSGIACDADETAVFDDREICRETERRQHDSQRSTEHDNSDSVTACAPGGDYKTDECAENGSQSDIRELDEETKECGIERNVLGGISVGIVTEVLRKVDEYKTFDSEKSQSDAKFFLEANHESDQNSQDEALHLEPTKCSDHSDPDRLSTTQTERVITVSSHAETAKPSNLQTPIQTGPAQSQVDNVLSSPSRSPLSWSLTSHNSVETLLCNDSKANGRGVVSHGHAKDKEIGSHGNNSQVNTILDSAAKDNADTTNEPGSIVATEGNDSVEGVVDVSISIYNESLKTNDVSAGRGDHTQLDDASRNKNNDLSGSRRDTRLLNIIHELKSYKKRLSTKVDDTPRCVDKVKGLPESTKVQTCASTYIEQHYRVNGPRYVSPCTVDTIPLAATMLNHSVHSPTSSDSLLRTTSTGSPWLDARYTAWQPDCITTSASLACFGDTPFTTGQRLVASNKASLPFNINDVKPCDQKSKMAHYSRDMGCHTSSLVDAYNNAISDLGWRNIGHVLNNSRIGISERAVVASAGLPDVSTRKRKALPEHMRTSVKKQRNRWIANCSDATDFLLNYGGRATNGITEKRVNDYSPTTGEAERFSTAETKVVASSHGAKLSRRAPVSSWSADDVYDFVLSSPHAALSAKEFLELRITGRVLQNLTAIQMMRILRIGEHAARAVRTAVEKLIATSPAHAQSVRK